MYVAAVKVSLRDLSALQRSTHVNVQILALLPYPVHALQTSGEAVYVADVGVSTQELFAAPVESTCALAKLGKVDPAPALKLPGVVAFVGMCLFSCLLLSFMCSLLPLLCILPAILAVPLFHCKSHFPLVPLLSNHLLLQSFPLSPSLISLFWPLLPCFSFSFHSACWTFRHECSLRLPRGCPTLQPSLASPSIPLLLLFLWTSPYFSSSFLLCNNSA